MLPETYKWPAIVLIVAIICITVVGLIEESITRSEREHDLELLKLKLHYSCMIENRSHEGVDRAEDCLETAQELVACAEDDLETTRELVACEEELVACIEASPTPP